MHPESLNELCATKVMGWKLFSPSHLNHALIWAKEDGAIQRPVRDFNPAIDAKDAILVLEKASGADNMVIAICKLALMISGVNDSEIRKALEEYKHGR